MGSTGGFEGFFLSRFRGFSKYFFRELRGVSWVYFDFLEDFSGFMGVLGVFDFQEFLGVIRCF